MTWTRDEEVIGGLRTRLAAEKLLLSSSSDHCITHQQTFLIFHILNTIITGSSKKVFREIANHIDFNEL